MGVIPVEVFHVGHGAAPRAVRISIGAAPNLEKLEQGLGVLVRILRGAPEAMVV